MAAQHVPFLLLCLVPLLVSVVHSQDADYQVCWWSKQSVPVVLSSHTQLLSTPRFRGHEDNGRRQQPEELCGIVCQSNLPSPDQAEHERILGYETVYENGTRTRTKITLQGFNNTSPRSLGHALTHRARQKRQVYGADGRFVISDSRFTTKYPFSTAVRLSTGCSGVLVSPKHVLTAAHCVHDGRDYLGSVQRLKVGMLQLRSRRKRTGGSRTGRRKGARREKVEEKPEEGGLPEGEKQNSIDGDLVRGRQGGKGRRRKPRRGDEKGEGDLTNTKAGEFGGEKVSRPSLERARRSVGTRKQPVFRWTRVKQTRVPAGWFHAENSNNSLSADYDYALLELKRPVTQKHMELGVAPSSKALTRIHFSGYDADKGLLSGHGGEKIVYRFCSVTKESDDLLYQHCDAEQGAAGAGVYIRLKQETGSAGPSGKGNWQRRVIGVFSGHRRVEVEGGDHRDFNVAVRITPPKYAQICHWIHGDPMLCKEV